FTLIPDDCLPQSVFINVSGDPGDLHSFPTRRSSDLLEIEPRFGGKVPAVFGELLIGEQPGLDPLGQLNLLPGVEQGHLADLLEVDRKSTRLNSSHVAISYAVFCLKKKKPET